MQWLTPTRWTPNRSARARAAVATIRRNGPSPGPMEKAPVSMVNYIVRQSA